MHVRNGWAYSDEPPSNRSQYALRKMQGAHLANSESKARALDAKVWHQRRIQLLEAHQIPVRMPGVSCVA
jgi:hypothetical protein